MWNCEVSNKKERKLEVTFSTIWLSKKKLSMWSTYETGGDSFLI